MEWLWIHSFACRLSMEGAKVYGVSHWAGQTQTWGDPNLTTVVSRATPERRTPKTVAHSRWMPTGLPRWGALLSTPRHAQHALCLDISL